MANKCFCGQGFHTEQELVDHVNRMCSAQFDARENGRHGMFLAADLGL